MTNYRDIWERLERKRQKALEDEITKVDQQRQEFQNLCDMVRQNVGPELKNIESDLDSCVPVKAYIDTDTENQEVVVNILLGKADSQVHWAAAVKDNQTVNLLKQQNGEWKNVQEVSIPTVGHFKIALPGIIEFMIVEHNALRA